MQRYGADVSEQDLLSAFDNAPVGMAVLTPIGVITACNVSDRKRLEAELSHRALHDPLTGLANRTLLAERLRESLGRRGRHTRLGHLFYLDLDRFKAVNDRFGHAVGDAVLTQLAARIVALLRVGDVAARLGGDEFAVFCEDTEPQQALVIARRLRLAAADPFVVDGSTITISAAVGCCATEHSDAAALIREADRRMYEGKRRRPLRGRRSGGRGDGLDLRTLRGAVPRHPGAPGVVPHL